MDIKRYIFAHMHELDFIDKIQKLAHESKLFPDNVHPSSQCYRELAERIIKIVCKPNVN